MLDIGEQMKRRHMDCQMTCAQTDERHIMYALSRRIVEMSDRQEKNMNRLLHGRTNK